MVEPVSALVAGGAVAAAAVFAAVRRGRSCLCSWRAGEAGTLPPAAGRD